MSPRTLTPFARLVRHIASALRTTAVISIPADILASIKDAAQPLDDTGLRDLVQLFSPSHQGNRSCLEAVTLSQLVQIVFRLQPSLLQHNLIYSLLLPPEATGMDAYSSWQKSVSGRLVPTLLRLLEQGTLAEDLLVTAAHSLYLWIAGHDEAKRTVYSGREALRRALGTLVTKRDNYVLRIVVANLIRELLANRLDRHLFWPQGTPGVSFNEFPLSRLGDAGWLARVVEFLSAVNTSKVFRTDLPEVYHVQHSESEQSVAIVSDGITIVLPATSERPLRLLQLPLVDGMVCQSTAVVENKVKVQYRPTTGYHISRGVRKAADELHLAFRDPAQRVAFAESVHSRVAKRVVDASPAVQLHSGTQRTSYAVVDLTQLSETSFETEEETDHFAPAPEPGASISLPRRTDTQAAPRTPVRQEPVNGIPPNLPQAQVSPLARHPPTHETPKVPEALHAIHSQRAGKENREQEFVMSSLRADKAASESTNDSRRRLKRPRPKLMGRGNSDGIDWDQDLRSDDVELGDPTPKKAKTTTSTKAKTAKKATTAKNPKALLKGDDKKNKTTKSKAKGPSGKTAAATRTLRSAAPKSSKYVQEAQSDLEDNDGDQHSLGLLHSEIPKHAPFVENEVHINDSQGQVGDKGVNSHKQDSNKTLPHATSSPSSPHSARDRMSTVQEEAADDLYPMDKAAKAGALAKDRTSFGMKMAEALTTKAHLPVAVVEKQSRKSFGDAKTFVETVNVTRNSSPPKKPAEEPHDAQRKMRKAPANKPVSADGRVTDIEAQPSLAQVHIAEPSRHPPEAGPDHTSTAGGRQAPGGIWTAHKERPPIFTDTENLDQTPPAILQPDYQEAATSTKIAEGSREEDEANGIPNEDLELASVALKHTSNQKTVITNITPHGDSDDENQVAESNIGDDTPDPMLSRHAITTTERSLGKRKSRKVLQEIPKGANVETPMHHPPLPRGSERRSIQSPVNTASNDRERSLPMTDEYIQRKTPIVSFDARGPRNQGVVSPTKHPKLGDASGVVPPEMRAHAAAKRQKKLIQSEPIKLPEIAPIRVAVSESCSETVEMDKGTLGQEGALASGAAGETSDVSHEDEGITAYQEETIEQVPAANAISRENASQTSRVDENGSPRLHHTRKSVNLATTLSETPITAEQSETAASESEELEHSLYTEDSSSSPADNHLRPASIRVTLPPKAKLIHSRPSIGLQAVLSEKFPDAPKVVSTAAFKKKAKFTLAKPPVVIEKASTVIRKADNIPQPEASLIQAAEVGISCAAPAASLQPLFSDPSNHVTRLSPKVPANSSKALQGPSPTPALKTAFKDITMPPPPLPHLTQKQSELTGAAIEQGMRKKGFTVEDEDLTLIDVEGPIGHERQVRPPTRRQREPSPDSSANSEPSSTPAAVQLETEKRNEDQDVVLPELRMTQQNIRNVLNRAAANVLLRLQAAEQAIQSKTQEYHAGCYATIGKLETSHTTLSSHQKAHVAPRVAALSVTYNTTIEYCSKGLQRIRSGVELPGFSEKIGKRQNYLLSLMASQLHETDTS